LEALEPPGSAAKAGIASAAASTTTAESLDLDGTFQILAAPG
jgi:hypothetical protein